MKKAFALIFAVAFLGNCATLFGTKERTIPVITTPEGADVSLYSMEGNKIFEGKTPCTIKMNKDRLVDGKVLIQKPNYRQAEINLGRKIENAAIANVCCLGVGFFIGAGIDYINGNLHTPMITDINIILEPAGGSKAAKETEAGKNNK